MWKLLSVVSLIAIAALLAVACGSAPEPEVPAAPAPAAPAPTAAPVAQAQPAAPAAEAPKEVTSLVTYATAAEHIQGDLDRLAIPTQHPQTPDPYDPIRGGHLDVASLNWVIPRQWDYAITNVYGVAAPSFFIEGLTNFAHKTGFSPTDYTSFPYLAESWEMSGDGKTWTFSLRKGVHWAVDPDGIHEWIADEVDTTRDVTAHDWVASTALTFGFESSRYFPKFPEIDGPESFTAMDDYTLQVALNSPSAPFLYKLSHKGPHVWNAKVIERNAEEQGIDLLEAMNSINVQVGTGPFILTKWEPDVSVSYDMNPNYWGTDDQGNQVPFVDSVTLFGMNDERLQDAGFRTGKLGAIGLETCSLSPQRYWDLNKTNSDTQWNIFVDPSNTRAAYPNFGEDGQAAGKPWGDIRVRRAMALAIDAEGWVESILGGWGLPYTTPLTPGNQWWLQPGQYGDYDGDGIPGERYLEYDIEGAKALLTEAGYGPGDIQGVFMSSNDLGATWFAEAEYIVEAWRNIGIDMGIVIRDGAARGAAFREGDFDFGYSFPGFGFEPVDWFGSAFHSEINKQNQPVSGLVDLELDKKIDSMNAELDPLKRFEKVADIQRYLQEKQYYAFGANWIQIQATACWLRNHQWHYTHQNGLGLARSWIDKSACN